MLHLLLDLLVVFVGCFRFWYFGEFLWVNCFWLVSVDFVCFGFGDLFLCVGFC